MKIAFFGTSDRSIPIIESLHNNFELGLCVTKSGTKVGRKQEIRETAVKTWAGEHEVNYLCIDSIKESEEEIIKSLKKHKVDLGIVTDFSFIIPKSIISTPSYGIMNVHFSLLPKLRGASPVQHAILQGLSETGITYYLMDEHMDTGEILHQIRYPLNQTETSGFLYDKLFAIAADNLPQVINDYAKGKIKPEPQNNREATYCYSKTHPRTTHVFKEDAKIDWHEDSTYIERKIRAFYPWPVAWTTLGELEKNDKLPGFIQLKTSAYPNLRVKITAADSANRKLKIKKLQVEGKNEIDWMSFVNGYAKRK